MRLTDEQLQDLTKKRRPSAQKRVLESMGIPYRQRTDGSVVVLLIDLYPPQEPVAEDESCPELDEEKRIASPAWFDEHWREFYEPLDAIRDRVLDYAVPVNGYLTNIGPAAEGVYFLFSSERELLYVGKAANIVTRLVAHRKVLNFSLVAWILVPAPWNLEVEAYYISRFKPSLNIHPGYGGQRFAALVESVC